MKDELGGQLMKRFVGLAAKTCSYIKKKNEKKTTTKGTKKCVIKRNIKFRGHKKCLKPTKVENRINC